MDIAGKAQHMGKRKYIDRELEKRGIKIGPNDITE
jgi:hypothetical protein